MVAPKLDYHWKSTRLGCWERDIDEAEEFYASLARLYEGSGRMFFAITGHVSISFEISPEKSVHECGSILDDALRRAWLALRFTHPSIASWTGWSSTKSRLVKVYESPLDLQMDPMRSDWLRMTFQEIWDHPSGRDWCNADPPAPKLPTLYVIHPDQSNDAAAGTIIRRDLVIRSPHDVMDGIGTLHLLNQLLEHTSDVLENEAKEPAHTFGEEWERLSPPMRVALGLESPPSKDIKKLHGRIVAENTAVIKNVNMLTMPFQQGALVPGKHQRLETNLSAAATSRLLSSCETAGVSVTQSYHAAAIVALSCIQTSKTSEQSVWYINYALINLRDRCRPEYRTSSHAASVYHCVSPNILAIDMTISAATTHQETTISKRQVETFKRVLPIVRNFYWAICRNGNLKQLCPLVWANYIPSVTFDTAEPPPIPLPNKNPSVSISSLGVVDKIISPERGPLQIHNPWVTGEELGTGLGLFLGTFRGQLSLSAAFNEAWHDASVITDFLKLCNDIVWAGLGLED